MIARPGPARSLGFPPGRPSRQGPPPAPRTLGAWNHGLARVESPFPPPGAFRNHLLMSTDPLTIFHRGASSQPAHRRVTPTGLRAALGAIWFFDGLLQLQPFMFTRSFVNDVLVPSAQGNPGFVARPTLSIAHFITPDIVAWNAVFATIQVLIGAGIIIGALRLRPGILRLALAGSFAWSLLVWWLSEGLGGALTAGSPLSGAPGAVILYVIIGTLLWPGHSAGEDIAPAPQLGGAPAKTAWLGLWVFSGFLLLEPANQTKGAISSLITQAASGEPGFLNRLLSAAARSLQGTGPWLDMLLAFAMLAIGIAVAFNFHPRAFLAASIALATAIWIFGEALGGILTGQGTDPNSGPLLVLFALCMWAGLAGSRETSVEPGSRKDGTADHPTAGLTSGAMRG